MLQVMLGWARFTNFLNNFKCIQTDTLLHCLVVLSVLSSAMCLVSARIPLK
jgi:hypothetical protein